ncbi:hypothetical protein [Streptomyces sp. NPDC101150]|uniref:hypothetical protein n=1 Tax=Streptomyces sp. NPDC101150 TaxID=3366114 RepID=UPI0037F8364C
MILDPDTSRKITHYRPREAPAVWEDVAPLVRSVVTAVATAVPYEVERLLHITASLALWAEGVGLARDPDAWLRNEVIDAYVLSRAAELKSTSVQTYRTWLLRIREALAWSGRGEASPARLHGAASPHTPYSEAELAGLRHWAMHLSGQQRSDALALMALGAGCGLQPREVAASRGCHLLRHGKDEPLLHTGVKREVPLAVRADWEDVVDELAQLAGKGHLFRPRRTTTYAKNLVGSWSLLHRPPEALPKVSAGRLRATWIVKLMATGLSHDLIAKAAGLASTASLARYEHHVPPLDKATAARLLRGATT